MTEITNNPSKDPPHQNKAVRCVCVMLPLPGMHMAFGVAVRVASVQAMIRT
jgi:hypothetical protein